MRLDGADGWLRPMDTAELRQAVIPCLGAVTPLGEVHPTPVLTPFGLSNGSAREKSRG
jgi:hypothetical protein